MLKRIVRLFGWGMVALADIASGLFATKLLTKMFGIDDPWWLYIIGICFALSPDLDIVVGKLIGLDQNKGVGHRALFHRPSIVWIGLIVTLLLRTSLPDQMAFGLTLFFATTVLHFLHDSIDDTNWWGLPWLPFSKTCFGLLMHRNGKDGRLQLLVKFDAKELATMNPNILPTMVWFERYFFKPSVESVVSVLWFALSVGSIIFWR